LPRPSASAIRGKDTSGDGVRTVVRADDGKIPVRAILVLLDDDVDGEVAEEPFATASAGEMPAGSLLFDAADSESLAAAGRTYFGRVLPTRP
jgi:hypothetical protein